MKIDKSKLLKFALNLAALYYLVAAIVHLFGLTLFPFYDGRLYTPYHDTVIALVAIILALLLLVIARNPVKNADTLNVVIIACFIAFIFSIGIIWKIDFATLGAPAKKLQTIVEAILLLIFGFSLMWLRPKQNR
jgi:hypothetical protein